MEAAPPAAPAKAEGESEGGAVDGAEEEVEQLSLLQNLFQNVLSNPFIWGLAFTYFCVYVVRQGRSRPTTRAATPLTHIHA